MTANARLQGSLDEFGLVEVLQMMEFGSMTGAIHLKQQSTERIGIVYFKDGKLASCSELDPGALTLGDILQQLGMANKQQIDQALHGLTAAIHLLTARGHSVGIKDRAA